MTNYITIVGANFNLGPEVFKLGSVVHLIKDYDNKYDSEAIACEMDVIGRVGFVANSHKTVAKGTMSAGRIYDKFDHRCDAEVMFIIDDIVICRLL